MKFSELIDSCIECLKGFNPIIKTIDSHADDFLKDVSALTGNKTLVQGPLRKSVHQAGVLWVCPLPRVLEGLQHDSLQTFLVVHQPKR